MCCGMCDKCGKISAILLLLLGIAFLLVDRGVWAFWGINWWTALLLLAGIVALATGECKECQKSRKKKK